MPSKNIAITAIIVIAVGIGSFFGGMQYQKSSSANTRSERGENGRFAAESGQGGSQRRQGGAGFNRGQSNSGGAFENGQPRVDGASPRVEAGEVIAKDDKSITLKTRDGSSKIIFFSDSTTVGKTAPGSSADLNVGQNVMVNGQSDSSGTITAQNIQIRPEPMN